MEFIMPKATLEYDLSVPDDKEELQIAQKYRGVLWDLDQALRNDLKYNDKLSEDVMTKLEEYRTKLHRLMDEAGITTWYWDESHSDGTEEGQELLEGSPTVRLL